MMHTDLFPETLLVWSNDNKPMTSSLKVAEYFGKRHCDVLRSIVKLEAELSKFDFGLRKIASSYEELVAELSDNRLLNNCTDRRNFWPICAKTEQSVSEQKSNFGRLNFEPSSYLNAQQKEQPMYLISHDGFALLAMGFTGKEALQWEIRFLEAFRQMEEQLRQRESRFADALDKIRPCLRPVVEATEQGLSRAEIAAPIGKSPSAVTYHRRTARRLGLLS